MLFGFFIHTFRIGDELISELDAIVSLDGFDLERSCLYKFFNEDFSVVDGEIIIDFSEPPPGAVIYGSVLVMLLGMDPIRDIFDICLNFVSGIRHLIAFGVFLPVFQPFRRNQVFSFEDMSDGGLRQMKIIKLF
jgi:hypothetical protein